MDIAQPDIAASGGLSEFQKISALGKPIVIRFQLNDKTNLGNVIQPAVWEWWWCLTCGAALSASLPPCTPCPACLSRPTPATPHTWRTSRSLSSTGDYEILRADTASFTSNVRNKNPLRDELLLDHEFVLGEDGTLAVPLDKPGLGVTVNMEALERFKI